MDKGMDVSVHSYDNIDDSREDIVGTVLRICVTVFWPDWLTPVIK